MGHDGDGGRSNAAKDITFGCVAGMSSKLFEHPFDLVKVRLQSQSTDGPQHFAGPLDCFKRTYSKEGWRGLYRGVSMPLIGAAAENATLFLVYNKCQDAIRSISGGTRGVSEKALGKRRELSIGEKALAAAGAGAAASFVLTPIELVKCRMQVQMLAREGHHPTTAPSTGLNPSHVRPYTTATTTIHPFKPPIATTYKHPPLQGPVALVRSTIAQYGVKGLWLGQMGTLIRETGGSSAWFTAYEIVSGFFLQRRQANSPNSDKKLTKADLKTWELMVAGACAGMSYNIVLFPADSIKSAMQTADELRPSLKNQPRRGFIDVAKEIYLKRGIKGLYAGCGLTVARAAPSSAMIFLIYESLEKRFGDLFA